ncbi:MAG: FAD-dependent oxidoreductase, partial [Pseudaminobacter sp.]|nr:FAD-dependent oxidoreductase [Pseudaminobacter sp.]
MNDCCSLPHNGGYDLAVVGAGSAGFSAAITAANEGARVALIGHGLIGGTCVNIGCVPSKTMIRAAEALHGAKVAARFAGIAGEANVADWSAVVSAKDELVSTLRQKKYADLLPAYEDVTYIEGRAQFAGDTLNIDGASISAGKTIITTGAAPALPDIEGIANVPVLTSTTALELTELPASLLVIGGGYIGCELAQMFARMGTAVTLVTRSRLLPEAEPEVSGALTGYLREEGITVRTGLSYRRVSRSKDGIALLVRIDGRDETLTATQVLAATGRTPNTRGMNLAEAGVETDARGAVVV